jgi:negative regulator of sigma E activity
MTRGYRILLTILIVLIVMGMSGLGAIKFWTRPGRLDAAKSVELLSAAWNQAQIETPSGPREVFYDLGGKVFRIRSKLDETAKFEAFQNLMASLFPQVDPSDEFLGNLTVTHRGRVRIAGVTCERILVSPALYDGNSIELWIEPGKNLILGYRTIDFEGNLVRGYRFLKITGTEPVDDSAASGTETPDLPFLNDPELVPPERIQEMADAHIIALPDWLPPGFKLRGGRRLANFDQPAVFDNSMPGLGVGRMQSGGGGGGLGPRPGQGPLREFNNQFQLVYTDGLNTISVIQLPQARMGEGFFNPDRQEEVLAAKAGEIWRLFHTAMAGRFLPNATIIVYGEVSPEIAKQIAGSIPDLPLVPPMGVGPDDQHQPFPPDGMQPFGPERPRPDRPFSGGPGEGFGGRRPGNGSD